MQSLETIKGKGQEGLNRLVELGKSQPAEVQTWGVTGGAAVAGALALTAVAKGVLAVVGALAAVALAVGAVAGGLAGWSLMQQPKATTDPVGATTLPEASASAPVVETPAVATPTLNEATASA